MRKSLIISLLIVSLLPLQAVGWEFVVIADFLNQDTLSPKQEKHSARVLNAIAQENPEFVMIPGDLAMAHWFITEANVRTSGNRIYEKWKARFNKRDLDYYTAIGDHELGDLPAINYLLQGYLLPEFKRTYKRNFNLPKNGPEGYKELAYFFVEKNTLFITVMTFDIKGWFVTPELSQSQLTWLDEVLERFEDKVNHIIVQGHLPVLPVKSSNYSSKLMVKGNSQSELWQIMAKHNVDYYLAGEFHSLDVSHKDGITQIVTGGLVGKTSMYYVVFNINEQIHYTIKEVRTDTN